jgi:hypothetical protein
MTSTPSPLVARFIRHYSAAHGVPSALSPKGFTACRMAGVAISEAAQNMHRHSPRL